MLEAPVRTIAWSESGVEIEAGDVRVEASAAIVAVAPNLAAAIRFSPALPAWRMRLQQASSQGSVTKVLAVYPEPFWRAEGLSGEGFAPHQLVREIYDNTPPSASVGVLCTFLPGEQAEFAARLHPARRRELVLEGLSKFVGPSALQRDGLHRGRLVGGGVDARRVRVDLRHRRPHALRRRHAPARRPDPLGVRRHRGRRAHAHGGRRPLRRGGGDRRARPLAHGVGVQRGELADGRAGLTARRAHPAPEQEADERDHDVMTSVSVARAFSAGVGAVRPVA